MDGCHRTQLLFGEHGFPDIVFVAHALVVVIFVVVKGFCVFYSDLMSVKAIEL